MGDPDTISSAPPARVAMNYAALRQGGMELIRKWASQSWTDHNVHDPGITILEACSYAMTELGLRVQLDVGDLLRSGEPIRSANLEPAHRVLPVGPVSPQDLRSLLLDHPLVSDAQLFLPADGEVQFYELAGANPPLTYSASAGGPRIRPGGLYEVLVELVNRDLNSNTYSFQVAFGGKNYDIDLALPFWDEPEAAPFRQGAVVNTVAMVLDGTRAWSALPESQSYFGKLDIAYTLPSGAGHLVSWALLRITTVLTQPGPVVPGILAAARAAVESTAAGAPVLQFANRPRLAAAAVSQLQSYLAGWRNLGEQAVRIGVGRVQEIAVRARIEVTGGIDVEQLLANIFVELDKMLSPRVRFESLAARRSTQPDPDKIYTGPLLRNGFLAADALDLPHPSVLFLSDVLRVIMRQRSAAGSDVVTQENPAGRDIVAVTDLTLTNFINNRPITSDAEDCLKLVEIQRYRPSLSVAKSRIVLVRNDAEVSYDIGRVETLVAGALLQIDPQSGTNDPSPVWPVKRGDLLPIGEYTPLQEELPAIYGVGHSVLPDSAGTARLAGVRQLQGYLLLFEQILADVTTQLVNINRFFSGSADEDTTYFTRPPFDLPGVSNLLRQFTPGGNWAAFVGDPNNAVARALHAAAESPTEVLDRRNRMLDHLLARQGEDMVAFGQELHRWAQLELAAMNLPVAQQAQSIAGRRDAANARLSRIKAALLHDAPELNAFRLLANSNPLFGDPGLLRITPSGTKFSWQLAPGNQERLRSTTTFDTKAAAHVDAENALAFAARSTLYVIVDIGGGQRRLNVMDGSTATARVVAESSQTFAGDPAATAAVAEIAAVFARLRLESSLSPFERRVAYLTGIRSRKRRRLLTPTSVNFQIVDDPPGGGQFGKRWRLFELPSSAGQVLLNSTQRFTAPTDAAAVQLAQDSIRLKVLRYGMDEWNYVISAAPGNTFTYQLKDPSGAVVAVREAALASNGDAQRALAATVELLYRSYGAEGFYLVEHLLLRPRKDTDQFLSLPAGPKQRERDPYSQRISLVFPSGYARDFSLPRATAPTSLVTPDRFRDPEFRTYAERVIQQTCPAHLMPTVYWVDRSSPGGPASTASLDTFEQRYFDWLDTVLIPGAQPDTVDAARAAMAEALNAIANDTP
jgi:hypothetical protein